MRGDAASAAPRDIGLAGGLPGTPGAAGPVVVPGAPGTAGGVGGAVAWPGVTPGACAARGLRLLLRLLLLLHLLLLLLELRHAAKKYCHPISTIADRTIARMVFF